MVKVDGFVSLDADVARQEAKIRYDSMRTTPEKLAASINANTDFKASVKGE